MEKNLSSLERKLNVKFHNQSLLRQALIHRSYLNEHRRSTLEHNERLEFLGDAVLEIIVTEYLYKNFPNPEGELTNLRASLVNAQTLCLVAKNLEIEKFLYLSRGEAKEANSKARQTILANALEAIIGAIYLDKDYEETKEFIMQTVVVRLPEILKNKLYQDAKSRLQEIAQEKLGVTPNYKVLEEAGPDHAKRFRIGVYLNEEEIAIGNGTSKQEAQMRAAEAALKVKKWETK